VKISALNRFTPEQQERRFERLQHTKHIAKNNSLTSTKAAMPSFLHIFSI
jgi:hypothetical protein